MCGNGKYALWPRFSVSDFWGPPSEQGTIEHVTPGKDFTLEIDETNSNECLLVFTLTGYRYIIEEVMAGADLLPDEFPDFPFEINSFNGDHRFELSLIVSDEKEIILDSEFEYDPDVSSINSISTNNFVKLFPNPTEDRIHIESEISFNSFRIINIQGSVIKQGKNGEEIDVSDMNSGIYILQLYTPEERLICLKFNVLK